MTSGSTPRASTSGPAQDGLIIRAAALGTLTGDLRAVDVSTLSGVSQSTVSRLWDNPRWIERVEGTTLCKLMAVSPSVAHYVRKWGESQRLEVAAESAAAVGVAVRRSAVADLARVAPASTVIAALSAVGEMMQGHYDNASRLFASSWGYRANGVADTLFEAGQARVFENLDTILAAADAFVTTPPAFTNLPQIVGYGVIEHKLIKSGVVRSRQAVNDQKNALAFLVRSAAIARILSDDDLTFVDRYRDRVFAQRDLAEMELWSHATYAHDLPVRQHFVVSATSLTSTAAMTSADIRSRNDAYVYYLLVVALPLLFKRDPQLATRHSSIASALKMAAADRDHKRISAAAHKLCITHDLEH